MTRACPGTTVSAPTAVCPAEIAVRANCATRRAAAAYVPRAAEGPVAVSARPVPGETEPLADSVAAGREPSPRIVTARRDNADVAEDGQAGHALDALRDTTDHAVGRADANPRALQIVIPRRGHAPATTRGDVDARRTSSARNAPHAAWAHSRCRPVRLAARSVTVSAAACNALKQASLEP